MVNVCHLQDRRPLVFVRQLANFDCRLYVLPLINAFCIDPVKVIFGFGEEVVFPFIQMTSLCVRNDRFFRYFFFNLVARPNGLFSAFAREDLRIFRRPCRAFFNYDERVFLCVRLSRYLAWEAIGHACDEFPAELRLFSAERHLSMRVGILYCGVVTRMINDAICGVPLWVNGLVFRHGHVGSIVCFFR